MCVTCSYSHRYFSAVRVHVYPSVFFILAPSEHTPANTFAILIWYSAFVCYRIRVCSVRWRSTFNPLRACIELNQQQQHFSEIGLGAEMENSLSEHLSPISSYFFFSHRENSSRRLNTFAKYYFPCSS